MSEVMNRDLNAGLDPQALAERVRDGMFERDQAARGLGMTFTDVGPGRATMTMTVREDMLNGFRICHGGFITTLADTAFAYACNSGNEMTVASGISVDFMAPGRPGDVLSAEAREVSASGRTGVYDITVTNQTGELIAVMRGKSYRMKGRPVVEL
ncbi:phenylacetic acid degradation protein PaaD [Parazoarcus communis]|jgi:acyl-CoA thioesterase|uniref:Phenylacetic acid degradation protein PaaD n=1 Tax=Parazoarcus communis TaxID=41977 RepID=A0A2U8GZU2_9RHOO|nr:hydroxyphenylacetyl-CoA thioesterase PaaI [Parazoarcus communis]AWI79249.1 phenylacetic acid degradation protein PaaD [Parazoarcus communis]PKO58168.1 MAG: phenylacetic acid degradation protein PaaD [Betaproteobacteria bacterium HGW-Betaproteobacteria-19]